MVAVKSAKPRKKGRPTTRGSVGKEALVAAAREALKRKTPGEITLNEIAVIAGVDPALIRYYYGQLEDLFAEAATEITREMRGRLAALIAEKGSPREKLERRIKVYLEVFRANPHYHRLIVQSLHRSKTSDRTSVSRLLEQSLEELDEIVREGAARGELKDLDPRFLQLGIAAMCEFFHSAHPIFEAIFGPAAANDAKFVDAYREFIIALISESGGTRNSRSRRASASRARARRPAAHAA